MIGGLLNRLNAKFVLLVIVGMSATCLSVSANDLSNKLNQHILQYVKNEKFQGAVLIAKNGQVIFKSSYGFADIKTQIPNSTKHQFLIGSLTKSFTAVAVMKLVEQNKLDLHVPVQTYIPNLKPSLGNRLTLHRLLKHQSGLPQHLEHLVTFQNKDISSNEILNIINSATLTFEPGSAYHYSNLNYHLAAIAIENVTGKSYPEAMSELVFKPLKMHDSGVERLSHPPAQRAKGYRKGLWGINQDENIVSYALGSGDIYSTVDDLLKWEQALYNDSFLSTESRQKLFTPENEAFGNYGYGFRILPYQRADNDKDDATVQNLGTLTRHGGSMDGFLANLHRYTDDRLTVIILANIRSFPIRDLTFELKEIALEMEHKNRRRSKLE